MHPLQALPTTAQQDRDVITSMAEQQGNASLGTQKPEGVAASMTLGQDYPVEDHSGKMLKGMHEEGDGASEEGVEAGSKQRVLIAVQARLEAKLVLSAALHVLRRYPAND